MMRYAKLELQAEGSLSHTHVCIYDGERFETLTTIFKDSYESDGLPGVWNCFDKVTNQSYYFASYQECVEFALEMHLSFERAMERVNKRVDILCGQADYYLSTRLTQLRFVLMINQMTALKLSRCKISPFYSYSLVPEYS